MAKLEEKACPVKETMMLQVLVYVADGAAITKDSRGEKAGQ